MSYEGGMFCFAEPEGEGDPNSGMRFDRIEVTDATGCWQSYAVLLGKLAKGQERELAVAAVLVREPDNKKNPDAVAVYVLDATSDGHKVGYLATDDARDYAAVIREMEKVTRSKVGCRARVYGRGTGLFARPVYMCSIYLPAPSAWPGWEFQGGPR